MPTPEEKKIEVTDGGVREEIEKLFGPNVVIKIDELGLTYDQAFDLVKRELIVQKASGAFVRAKAYADVHPKVIKERYETYLRTNPPQDMWKYQVVTIRGEDADAAAQKAFGYLQEEDYRETA